MSGHRSESLANVGNSCSSTQPLKGHILQCLTCGFPSLTLPVGLLGPSLGDFIGDQERTNVSLHQRQLGSFQSGVMENARGFGEDQNTRIMMTGQDGWKVA